MFSVIGGPERMRGVRSLEAFNRTLPSLLNRDLRLMLSNEIFSLKSSAEQTPILIYFDEIKARPARRNSTSVAVLNSLVANYSAFADSHGWTLAPRVRSNEPVIPVTAGIEIRPINQPGFGIFRGNPGFDNVKTWAESGNRVLKERYFIRIGAEASGALPPVDGFGNTTYTAASRARRITVSSELKAPNYSVRNNQIKIAANTSVNRGGTIQYYPSRTTIPATGITQIWQRATATRPASAKKVFP
jgi:hypothetical protein